MKKILFTLFISLFLITLMSCVETEEVDVTPPYFIGLQDFSYVIGTDELNVLENLTASDQIDGDLTALIEADVTKVDWLTPGVYPIVYTVSDQKNNIKTETVYVTVSEPTAVDTTSPDISGLVDLVYTVGDTLPNLTSQVTAIDQVDGDLTDELTIDDSSVDYSVPGTYYITYSVSDSLGNTKTLTRKITVFDVQEQYELNIFYINDTHGAIEANNDQLGLSAIGNLVINEKELHPDNTLFIGGGDLLQGNILSNYYYGSSMIDMLNVMQLDAFVLGNHEFDWGLEQILRYRDPSSGQIQANYPFLGANILRKDTMERPDFVDAYTIVQKGSIKVGIIGLMGYGLESSIATARVSNYVFDDPIYWASYYSEYLRTQEDVDVVIAVVHGNSNTTNQGIASLTGDSKVDVIFNGHSHSRYTEVISRSGVDVPVMQSKANGEYVGNIRLTLDENKQVTDFSQANLHPYEYRTSDYDLIETDARLNTSNQSVQLLIDEYKLAIEDLLTEVIITSSSWYDTNALTEYMAEIIRLSVNADLGIHNYGGTRASLSAGQDITVATLYQIFPFDNRVKYVYVTGSDIKDYANSSVYISYKDGLSLQGLTDDVYYLVATNDYIFDKVDYPFIHGVDPVDSGLLIRDLLEDVLRNQAESYASFNTTYPIDLTATE